MSKTYRQILKSTSIFGGVQVFNIVIQLLKSKIIAVLLGTNGIGILGLFSSTNTLLNNIFDLGIRNSSVKEISTSYNENLDPIFTHKLKSIRTVFICLGIVGLLIVFFISPYLSKVTFGNNNFTVGFRILSLSILFNQITNFNISFLQSIRKLKLLAKAFVLGNLIGFILSVPLYFYFGANGIVPSMLIASLTTMVTSHYLVKRIKLPKVQFSFRSSLEISKKLLSLGFFLSLSSILTSSSSYFMRAFIGRFGGLDEVGLYSAGFAIINTYVGLVFTSMATDYFPRLSAVENKYSEFKNVVTEQAEVGILILSPILVFFIICSEFIIELLYSKTFIPINFMVIWAALGMYFKIIGWCISYIFIAKGEGVLFFKLELIANLQLIALNIVGYYFLGLTGLGLSFLIFYAIYAIEVYILALRKYKIHFDSKFIKMWGFQLTMGIFSVILILLKSYLLIFGAILILTCAVYSVHQLNKRIDIKSLFKRNNPI